MHVHVHVHVLAYACVLTYTVYVHVHLLLRHVGVCVNLLNIAYYREIALIIIF